MADNVKTITPTPGTTLYTGAGLHPFRPGDLALVPAGHADDLVEQGVVEHVPTPTPQVPS
jgi:hypothetical protein